MKTLTPLLMSLALFVLPSCQVPPVTLPGFRPQPGRTASLVSSEIDGFLASFDGAPMGIPLGRWEFIIPAGHHTVKVTKDWTEGGWRTSDGQEANATTYAVLAFDAAVSRRYAIARYRVPLAFGLQLSAVPHILDLDSGETVSTLLDSWQEEGPSDQW